MQEPKRGTEGGERGSKSVPFARKDPIPAQGEELYVADLGRRPRFHHVPFGGGAREDKKACTMDSLSATSMWMITLVGRQKQEGGALLVPTIKSHLTSPGALPRTQEVRETAWCR